MPELTLKLDPNERVIGIGQDAAEASRQRWLAKDEADRSEEGADRAETNAAFAEEFSGPAYASQAAGEAATAEGQFFRVPVGTTPETYTRYQRTAGGSVEAASLATTSDLSSSIPGKGNALIIDRNTGATLESVERDLREQNILRFIDPAQWTNILNGSYTGDLSTEFASAIDSGESLRLPGKYGQTKYNLDGSLVFDANWQRVSGSGARIQLLGQDTSKNAFNFLSTRSTGGGSGATREHNGMSGLYITLDAAAAYKNIIWIEQGVFHAHLEDIRIVNQGGGEITNAFVKCDSGSGASYPNGLTVRDMIIRGAGHISASTPDPVGLDIEGLIESEFQRLKIYDVQKGIRVGSTTASGTVSTVDFIDFHVEIGNRKFVDSNAAGIELVCGHDVNFRGGKINVGNSYTVSTDQVPVLVTGHASKKLEAHFAYSELRGTAFANRAIYAASSATRGEFVGFRDCTFVDFVEGIGEVDPAAAVVIDIPRDRNRFIDAIPRMGRASSRSVIHDFGSLADGSGETVNIMTGFSSVPTDMPVLISINKSQQGMYLTGYWTNTKGRLTARMQNETGGSVDIASAQLRVRRIEERDIKVSTSKSWAPGSTVSGSQKTTTLTVPGARLGDFVLVQYKNTSTNNLNGCMVMGHISADNTARALAYNGTGGTINLTTADLRAVVLDPAHIDHAGAVTYDPPSLADGDGVETTVTVPGARLGDFVVISFSNDLQGVMLQGSVSSDDTVLARFQNESGGTVDIPTGTLMAGVYKNAMAL